MKALYETPEVERVDFAAMEAIADVEESKPGDDSGVESRGDLD